MRELERQTTRNPEATLPALAIVGTGRVGGALARAGREAGVELATAGRDEALQRCRGAKAALLCVPDAEIAGACEAIAPAVPPLRFVGHSSGATRLEALAAAAVRGAETFSLHPLQTVPDDGADVTGAPCAVSGSGPEALELARSLAERLGMEPFEVPEDARAAYHAAACMASNFLVALEETAAELLERSGIPNGRDLLAPLVLRSAANWSEQGATALTGPIARGDEETVERHLEALERDHPEVLNLYRAFAERTRALTDRTPETR